MQTSSLAKQDGLQGGMPGNTTNFWHLEDSGTPI